MAREGDLDCVTGLGKYKGRLIILLDIEKVLAVRTRSAWSLQPPPQPPLAELRNTPAAENKKRQSRMNTSPAPALTETELKLIQTLIYQGVWDALRRTAHLVPVRPRAKGV